MLFDRKLQRFIITVLLTSFCICDFAQSKLTSKCDAFIAKEEYMEGLKYLENQAESVKSDDSQYSYYMGMMNFYIPHLKNNATSHFENYISKMEADQVTLLSHDPVYYFLGQLYHLNYNWTKAQEYYQLFIDKIDQNEKIPEEERATLTKEPRRNIEQCDFGRILENNPRHVLIESLGDTVNTIYSEYAAVVSQNEERLVFTSRRPDTEGGKKAKEGGGYYEDIYTADLVKGSIFENTDFLNDTTGRFYINTDTDFEYINFRRMGSAVNSKEHDGSIQLHDNDQTLYFYRDADVWSVIVGQDSVSADRLGEFVNTTYHEPSIFFSDDNTKLFIVSDRPGGLGGLDIYLSIKEKGQWTEPKNLGPKVNTPYDEDAPYFDPDGITLYFSSKGHSSVGGYDVFRSRFIDGEWRDAVNIGFPVNTPADDIYFTMTHRYNRGYYSSSDLKGKGAMDIYRITFADERDPVAELFGIVKKGDDLIPATADIILKSGSDERIEERTDPKSGEYFLVLGHGKSYDLQVKTEGFVPFERQFSVPEQKDNYQLYQEVHVRYITNSKGEKIGQEITVYSALGNEEETAYYNEETREMIERIKNDNKITGDMAAMTLVHLYHTQNQLSMMMEEDVSLDFDMNANSKVFMLKHGELNHINSDSYVEYIESINRDEFLNPELVPTIDARSIDGLFFTVQIGVYSRDVPHSVLYNLQPLVTRQVNNNLHYRYSIGTYKSIEDAVKRKNEVIGIGITDAFVTAYYKGERIGPDEATELIKKWGTGIIMK